MKKMPYGINGYKELIEENYYYVDKTMYLEKLENLSERTLMYLRPGRFGKSLFTSLMFYYYDINSKDLFDILFKDTYIYNNPTKEKSNYYVLKFDFSGITIDSDVKANDLKIGFMNCVRTGINNFINKYNFNYEIKEEFNPAYLLKDFLSFILGLELKNKIYVIIDEYDHFTNGLLNGDAKLFKEIVSKDGFVKSFYEVIKEYRGNDIIGRFFATGICPITLRNMTTGFNICTDISTDKRFNSMIGLTHEDVNILLDYLGLKDRFKNNLYNIMLKHYDGYLFNEELTEENRVFNATLVMYLLSYYQDFNDISKRLYDNNIVINYDKIDKIIKLQNNEFYKDIINIVLENDEITGKLTSTFNLEEPFTRDDIISLLYYFGYLTIKEMNLVGDIVFSVPNQVMKVTYSNYFLKILRDNNIIIDNNIVNDGLLEIVTDGNIDILTNYISKELKLVSNRLFKNINEASIELLYFTLIKSDLINVYTELECNGGYADVFIEGRVKPLRYDILIELKYISKKEYNENIFKEKRNKAVEQLNTYSLDDRIKSDNLRKYVVIFKGDEVKLIEEIK